MKKLLAERILEVEAMKRCFIKKVVIAAKRRWVVIHLIDRFKLAERRACYLSNLSRSVMTLSPKQN